MKKNYEELEYEIILVNEDVITESGEGDGPIHEDDWVFPTKKLTSKITYGMNTVGRDTAGGRIPLGQLAQSSK